MNVLDKIASILAKPFVALIDTMDDEQLDYCLMYMGGAIDQILLAISFIVMAIDTIFGRQSSIIIILLALFSWFCCALGAHARAYHPDRYEKLYNEKHADKTSDDEKDDSNSDPE